MPHASVFLTSFFPAQIEIGQIANQSPFSDHNRYLEARKRKEKKRKEKRKEKKRKERRRK